MLVRRVDYRIAVNLYLMGGVCVLATWVTGLAAGLGVAGGAGIAVAFDWSLYFGAILWFLMLAPCLGYLALLGIWFRSHPGRIRLVAVVLSPLLAGFPGWLMVDEGLSRWVIVLDLVVAIVFGATVRTPRRHFVGSPAEVAS